MRVALGVAHAAAVVDVLPPSFCRPCYCQGSWGCAGRIWSVLAASGVCCLQLRLYAAVHRCCRLLPAADVAAAGQDLIYSLGAAVAAAGLLPLLRWG